MKANLKWLEREEIMKLIRIGEEREIGSVVSSLTQR